MCCVVFFGGEWNSNQSTYSFDSNHVFAPFQGTSNKKDWDQYVRSKEKYRMHEYFEVNKIES